MNRQQRRLKEKTARKAETISKTLQKGYEKQMNSKMKEHEEQLRMQRLDNIENDWNWFYAILGITLSEKYHWSTEMIGNLFKKTSAEMDKTFAAGNTREETVERMEEMTGVTLVMK